MFLNFVNNSKLRLNSNKLKWIVLGNESSDLDSVVSCLVYAYFKQNKFGKEFDYIPVCCISKENLELKKEVIEWLKMFGIDSFTKLVLLNDVEHLINNKSSPEHAKFCLLDHHKPLLPIITQYVREVIDHREIVFNYCKGQLELNNVQLVGSCCTLITKYILERSELEDRPMVLEMLRGVILLDTDCLAKMNGKTTLNDVETVEAIENSLGLSSCTRQEIFNLLLKYKSDISGLSLHKQMLKDLKILELTWQKAPLKIAIPTLVSVDIKDILDTPNLKNKLSDILKTLIVDVIVGLTCGTSSKQRRGYFIFSKNCEVNNMIYEYLLLPKQKLNLHSLFQTVDLKCFYQDDLLTSRNFFLPIIEKLFNANEQFYYGHKNNCNYNIRRALDLSINDIFQKQKLRSEQIEMTACGLVKNVLKESEEIAAEEINLNVILTDWSDYFALEERNEIISSFKSNNLTKLAKLLTSVIIRDSLKSEETFISQFKSAINNNSLNNDNFHTDELHKHKNNMPLNTDETLITNEEINFYDCHLGHMLNEENQNIPSNFVNSSSAHVVENSSFNLYRRISNNKLNFSLDEKALLATIYNWSSKEDDILSDSELIIDRSEYKELNQSHYQSHLDLPYNDVKKVIFPDKDFDSDVSIDISLNGLDNMATPHFEIIEELVITENHEFSSPN